MKSSLLSLLVIVAAAPALVSQATPGAYFTYGAGCQGSNGTPRLTNVDFPVIGQTFTVGVDAARPLSAAVLLIGASNTTWPPISLPFDLGVIGAPGCSLLASGDVMLTLPTSAAGSASLPLAVPNDVALLGAPFFNQFVVLDPGVNNLGVVVSNGGAGRIGSVLPQVTITSILPLGGNMGGPVTIRGTNFGTNPFFGCIRIVDTNGGTDLFVGVSMAHDTMTGEDVLTARLATVTQSPIPGPIMVLRGSGGTPQVNATTRLSAPAFTFAWQGNDQPQNAGMGARPFTPGKGGNCPATKTFYGNVSYDLANARMVLKLPAAVCTPPSSTYPMGTTLITDVHWNINCPGPVTRHFDHFTENVTVTVPAGVSNTQVTSDHRGQIQQAFDTQYGSGIVNVTYDAGTNEIRITMVNPNCTITDGGGNVVVCCP